MKTNTLSLLLLVWLIFLPISQADIYISEVLYNPLVTESGGEAVELYNDGDNTVNLSGYTLRTASSAKDATLPSTAIIEPNSFYLITDANWDEKKDTPVYPKADHEEAITMKNTDSGIALVDVENNTIDKVGWGDKNSIESTLFDKNPSNDSKNGESLQRIAFSGDNSIDFISAPTSFTNSFGESSSPLANSFSIIVEIQDLNDLISNISMMYDIDTTIFLSPGEEREVEFSFEVENSLPDVKVFWEESEFSTQKTNNIHQVSIDLPHTTLPGNYSFIIQARSEEIAINKSIPFIVPPLLAFEMDLETISCTIKTEEFCNIEGDTDLSTKDKPTIKNLGNVELDFNIYGDDLETSTNSIQNSMKFSFSEDKPTVIVPTTSTKQEVNLGVDESIPFNLLIEPPINSESGIYSSQVMIIGIENE